MAEVIVKGYQTDWFYLPLDSSGDPIETAESRIDGVTGSDPITRTNTTSTTTRLAQSGYLPITRQFNTARGVPTFGLTMDYTGHLTQSALSSANSNGRNVAIRLKRYDDSNAEVENLTLICEVSDFTDSRPRDGVHEVSATFAIVIPDGPFVFLGPGPFVMSAGDSQVVRLDEVFESQTVLSYALGTLDPSTNSSASAVYAAGTKSLTITADASRTGTTKIPVTATDAQSRTGTYTFRAVVS